MKILVTGGYGFLGGALVEALAARGDEVIAADARIEPAPAGGKGRIIPAALDITDRSALEALFAAHRPEAVIHCAAIVIGVQPGASGTGDIIRVNIEGSVNLFETMARFAVKRVVHVSSEEIYGSFATPVADENHPLNPETPYAITKSAVEQLGRYYGATLGLEVINIRTSWVYGAGLPRSRIPKNLMDAALEGQPLHLPNGAGSAIDHTYIDDFVDGTLRALDAPTHGFDTYHIASGEATTVAQMVAIIREIVPGAEISVGGGEFLTGVGLPLPRKGALDVDRARVAFGYEPRFDLKKGLAAYHAKALRARRDTLT